MTLNSRSVMLALAENTALKNALVQNGMSKGFVKRFIAGETLADAVAAARELDAKGIRAAMDALGENVTTEAEAEASTDEYVAVMQAMAQSNLPDCYVSVKLTALGMDRDEALATANLHRLLFAAKQFPNTFVRVDMEGSAYTARTLAIVQKLHTEFDNIGTVLQSYLYRTDNDVKNLIALNIPVRLVKGAYAESPEVAYPNKADVDAAYLRQMRDLLMHGNHPAIATHDPAILREAKQIIREHRIPNDSFEFQLLLGIRRDIQESLARESYHVRAYIPFGPAWYPYFTRRLAERPANIAFVLHNLLK